MSAMNDTASDEQFRVRMVGGAHGCVLMGIVLYTLVPSAIIIAVLFIAHGVAIAWKYTRG